MMALRGDYWRRYNKALVMNFSFRAHPDRCEGRQNYARSAAPAAIMHNNYPEAGATAEATRRMENPCSRVNARPV